MSESVYKSSTPGRSTGMSCRYVSSPAVAYRSSRSSADLSSKVPDVSKPGPISKCAIGAHLAVPSLFGRLAHFSNCRAVGLTSLPLLRLPATNQSPHPSDLQFHCPGSITTILLKNRTVSTPPKGIARDTNGTDQGLWP